MMLKPIEEGCLAVTHNCKLLKNNGICVVVGKFVGEIEGWHGNNQWETDALFEGVNDGLLDNHMQETRLLRIDVGEFEEEETEELALVLIAEGKD